MRKVVLLLVLAFSYACSTGNPCYYDGICGLEETGIAEPIIEQVEEVIEETPVEEETAEEAPVVEEQQPTFPTEGLVAWYPFLGNANDEFGGNNGEVNGAELTTDRHGEESSAYYFANTTSKGGKRIDIDSLDTSSINTGLSISWWVKREGKGYISPRLFEFFPGANYTEGILAAGLNNEEKLIKIGHLLKNDQLVDFKVSFEGDNEWVYCVYTLENGVASFYINGELLAQENGFDTTSIPLGNDVAFGRMNHPHWDALNGSLDDIGIWNRALTQEEIDYLFNM